MKIGHKIGNHNGFPPKEGEGTFNFYHLIIENNDDMKKYIIVDSEIASKKNIQTLFGFKSQDFRRSLSDYIVHEDKTAHSITKLLSLKLEYKETNTTMPEICRMSDNIMFEKYNAMSNLIDKGYNIRVNKDGGYYPINDEEKNISYNELIECTDEILTNFILTGKYNDNNLRIFNKSVIIENGEEVDSSFRSTLIYNGINRNNLTILNNFKSKTILFTDNDYIELFQKGIDRGLRNICFETTGQDFHNITKLKQLLDYILINNKNITLNMFIRTHNEHIKELFVTKDNLKVTYL